MSRVMIPRLRLVPPRPPAPSEHSPVSEDTPPPHDVSDNAESDSARDAPLGVFSPIRPATAGSAAQCPVGTSSHGPVFSWYKDCVVLRCSTCAYAWHPRHRMRICNLCEGLLRIESHYGELGYVCPRCRKKRKFEKLRKLVHDV